MRRVLVVFVGVVAVIALPLVATAHNAGHLFLPDGSCQEVGAFNPAPLVGQNQTPLDLVPGTPQDEFGVSFVGVSRQTPIYPGACPAVRAAANTTGASEMSNTIISTTSPWGHSGN